MDWFTHKKRRDKEFEVDKWMSQEKLLKLVCPVCKDLLGLRYDSEVKEADCKDCNTTFTFFPGTKLPAAQVHSLTPEICKCFSCRSRKKG